MLRAASILSFLRSEVMGSPSLKTFKPGGPLAAPWQEDQCSLGDLSQAEGLPSNLLCHQGPGSQP